MLSLGRTDTRANREKERARMDAVTGMVHMLESDLQTDRETDRDRVKEVASWSNSKRTTNNPSPETVIPYLRLT